MGEQGGDWSAWSVGVQLSLKGNMELVHGTIRLGRLFSDLEYNNEIVKRSSC